MENPSKNTLLKKTPCDNCRQRKRRCSFGTSCERCLKLNIKCVYTVLQSPKDLEYLQEVEYMEQIKHLEQQMVAMEKEMNTLKLERDCDSLSISKNEESIETDYPSPVSLRTHYTKNHEDENKGLKQTVDREADQERERRIFRIARCNQAEVCITKNENQAKPWQMTLKNGQFTIDTQVESYSDLMNNLSSMLAAQKQTEHPTWYSRIGPFVGNSVTDTLTIVMWKKYGKTRLKSIMRYKPIFLQQLEAKQPVKVISLDVLTTVTFQLVYSYINCLHTTYFSIHSRSFVELFMSNQQDILRSPAVMALCSDICQRPCKHISKYISVDTAADYALYYFEQARDLVLDRFDEPSLEMLTTYVFMTSYKMKAGQYDKAAKYLAMVDHMYEMLLPCYENTMKKKDGSPEAKMFVRLDRAITHARHVLEMKSFTNGTTDKRKMFHKAMAFTSSNDRSYIYLTDNESLNEVQHIRLRNSILQLQESVKSAAKTAFGADFCTYVGTFTHQIEMAIRYWYHNDLPKEFALSLPLFGDMGDLEFFTALEYECPATSPFGLISSLCAYNEYLVAAKTFFPKMPEETTSKTEELLELFYKIENELPSGMERKGSYPDHPRLLVKMKHIRTHHIKEFMDYYDGTEEECFNELFRAMNPTLLSVDAPHVRIAVISALNLVRLIQFLDTHEYSCAIEVGWIMNAWEILRRAARFQSKLSIASERVKANILLCIQFLENMVNFTQNHSAQAFIDSMKKEFETLD